MATPSTAVIFCSPSSLADDIPNILLGLTVGERLLLALQTAGVERVAFIGDGPRPASDRLNINLVEAPDLKFSQEDDDFVLLPSDIVFDRGILAQSSIPEELPIRRLSATQFPKITAAPASWDSRLPAGQAGESGTGYALRVRDKQTAKLAERSLLKSLVKPIDGVISRHLNRKISVGITRHIVNWGLRPNQVTAAIMIIGVASGVFAAMGAPWWALVLAGLCFQGQSVLDGCDGELARLTYRFSKMGQWLDTIGDDATNYIFCFGLAIGIYRTGGPAWMLAAGVVVLLAQLAASSVLYARLVRLGTGDLLAIPDTVTSGPPRSIFGRILKILKLIAKRDFFALVVSCVAALGFPLFAFSLMAAGTFPMLVGVIVNEMKLRNADRSPEAV